jgi:hypothetical protein
MTQLLEQAKPAVSSANAQIKQLPETEQDIMATFILEELENETRWDKAFANSHDILAQLAAAALAEDKAGKTQESDRIC